MIIVLEKCLAKIKKIQTRRKVPFIVFAYLECLLGKINTCQNDAKKYFTEKKTEHTLYGYSLVTWLHVVHLINQKTNGFITEEKTVWKCFVKI